MNYELFLDEDNHLVLRYAFENMVQEEYYDQEALKVFNKIIKLDNKVRLKHKFEDGNAYFRFKDISIDFYDYGNVNKKIIELKKQEFKKNFKIVVAGAATTAVIGIIASNIFKAFPDSNEYSVGYKGEPITYATTLDNKEINIVEKTAIEEAVEEETNYIYRDVQAQYDQGLLDNVMQYWDIIQEVGNKWGVDPYLIRDIMMQESHGGKLTNKGQIIFSQWEGQILKVYNHNNNKYTTIVLTNDPTQEKFKNVDQRITEKDLENPYTSISMIGAISSSLFNHEGMQNLGRSIQMYNFGPNATKDLIEEQARVEGTSFDDIMNNIYDTNFSNYTYVRPNYGDPYYLNNILKQSSEDFNIDDGKTYTMKHVNKDGTITEMTFTFTNSLEKTDDQGIKL